MCKVSSPAKIILCGEHSVVYGYPAIAIPIFSHRAVASVNPTEHDFRLILSDLNQILTLNDVNSPLISLVRAISQNLFGEVPQIDITVTSSIPMASGFGSGAAVSTVIAKSLYKFADVPYEYALINAEVFQVEKHYHGTPSGIDNTVIVYEKPIYFTKGQQPEPFHTRTALSFLVADTGVPASTRETVQQVRARYNNQQQETGAILEEIAQIVQNIRADILSGHTHNLGPMLYRNHQLLDSLGVSSHELNQLVDAAIKAGALGAKLSGGGGGGVMIALVNPTRTTEVKHALYQAGAKSVTETQLLPVQHTERE